MGVNIDALAYNSSINCTNILSFLPWNQGLIGAKNYVFDHSINRGLSGKFDIRSFLVAHAINLGFYSDENCAGDINNCFQQNQSPLLVADNFEVFYFIDSSFEGMEPTECIISPNATSPYELFCTVAFQGFKAVPILQKRF